MRSSLELAYNTDTTKLVIPEYGRNIQKMVQHAIKIEDTEQRNKSANVIIKVMDLINPNTNNSNSEEHAQKLWAHLHIISNFELEVESPYKKPEKESYQSKPDEVPYPKNDIRFKHYGKIMEDMVKSASELSEGEDKEKLVKHIANLLKTSYLQWNRDSVNDSLIIKQLEELSVGKLTISADKLRDTSDIVRTFKKKKSNNKNYTKNKPRRKYHGSF
ncbi:DUF4290 domain-containing protein [Flavobacteriales bacterium]|jgi:hypothetical protein|nr:DUF4290 domain-containing protein [Flavobacteriales bacterium]